MATLSRRRRTLDIWPGFVDALASLLMVFVFVLLIFMLAQYFLTDTLAGRNKALQQLTQGIRQLADTLSLEPRKGDDLNATVVRLNERLLATLAERDALAGRADALQRAVDEANAALASERERLEAQQHTIGRLRQDIADAVEARERSIAEARDQTEALQTRLADEQARTRLAQREIDELAARAGEATARITLLNQQVNALREQLARLSAALESSEAKVEAQKITIADLGQRLNVALARKVEELGRYRSEFFGRLREVLGERPDIRIVGDRFLFQSELLFATGSAQLGPQGKQQLDQLARTLKEVANQIPPDIAWVLRVDGHTDRRPIHTAEFPSNWELSVARALSIVRYLIEQGIPPERLAATGFGEYRPLDPASTEAAFARNRRIELKLTGP